jgi:thioredoxin-related protein
LEVYDIDDDKVTDLLAKFKIRSVPVMILVDDDGNELKRWVGLVNMDGVKNTIETFKK